MARLEIFPAGDSAYARTECPPLALGMVTVVFAVEVELDCGIVVSVNAALSTDQRIFDGAEYPVPVAVMVHDRFDVGPEACQVLLA